MILPVGVGLKSWLADGSGGIDDDHGEALARRTPRPHLLGQKLGALVGARHIVQRNRQRFIADATWGMPMQPTVLV